MSTAQVPPTPENVAEFFAHNDGEYDDGGNLWFPSIKATDNVIEIAITPGDEDGTETEEVVHFRAVVVEGDETPIVLEWPAELGLSWHDGGDLLILRDTGIIRMYPRGVDEWDLSPAEAREMAAQLAAMADASEAAFPTQGEAETR
ncbi:hypothetical protein OG884_06135 [Streptosporangium sp. NBC_01755]|uniref:hypothetical protein n=1 Tax=Streptosporangium sp. NBC_01755 TaxID=2975949 RepID=UPI002DDC8826|nr:hypothetical protein [Streptosporangium sp. NBC_01755]WSD01506.1 hypothetical protein OG884_06135 [Streptosporangium sp. NBC_01755]